MDGPQYKNRTRIRVSGLLKEAGKILMVQVYSSVTNERVWMLPGGGLNFGEKLKDCLKREFREETGLKIEPDDLFAVNELVRPPVHAVECYFNVSKTSGKLCLGSDPERSAEEQIIKDIQWIPIDEIEENNIAPERLKKWVKNSAADQRPNFYSQKPNMLKPLQQTH